MLHVDVVCVGSLKERYLREACAEYEKRLGGFCRLTVTEVGEERLPDKPSEAAVAAALQAEGRRLLDKVPENALLTALCIEGTEMSSVELTERIQNWSVSGSSRLAFVIGGSWGLSQEVKQAARLQLSMSPMTFPHQLARVMLLEQLYRAMQIAVGGKYHK